MSENTIIMKINAKRVIRLRNQRAWSQQHLAEVCGLSLRTIQRVEKESKASQETMKAIACIFALQPGDLLVSEVDENFSEEDATQDKSAHKPNRFKTKLVLSASAFMAMLTAIIWVPVSSASGVEVMADQSILNQDTSETFAGNVSISIPAGYGTEIRGETMWTAGNTSIFEGNVNVEIELNGHRYQMQNAVVMETESCISISTDAATLINIDSLQ